jgi:hypothetical protein
MFQQNGGGGGRGGHGVRNDVHGFPAYDLLARKWVRQFLPEHQHFLHDLHRLVNHLRYEDLDRLRESIAHHEDREQRRWGVEYLRQKISREAWGQKLYLAYRKTQRMQEMHDILQTVVVVTCDLYQRWFHNEIHGAELIVSLQTLLADSNENIVAHNKRFGTKAPLVDPHREFAQHILDVIVVG